MDPGTDMSFEELQAWNCSIVNEIRTQKLNGGYTDGNGIVWDTDAIAIQNLNGVCTLIACGVVTQPVTWRDHNNTNHDLSPTDVVTLSGGLAVYAQTLYGVSWYHKANIMAMTDTQTLLDYDVTTGWPG